MQYVLTEEEYKELTLKRTRREEQLDSNINTLVAICLDEGEMKCIHRSQHSSLYMDYCDDCPLQNFCTRPKDYSQ